MTGHDNGRGRGGLGLELRKLAWMLAGAAVGEVGRVLGHEIAVHLLALLPW